MSVLVVHPFPDDADPLGFDAGNGRDLFSQRHAFRFDGPAPYPSAVFDGAVLVAGVPDPMDPMASVQSAVDAAYAERRAQPSPMTMRLAAGPAGDGVAVEVEGVPREPLGPARLWVALAEDPVHFTPPQAISNGVTIHRFTLRHAVDMGPVDLDGAVRRNLTLPLDPAWDPAALRVVAWFQAGADATRFAAHEVLQSANTVPGAPVVTQVRRAVLVELLSATWCDPCLYGDTAVDALAVREGLAPLGPAEDAASYLQPTAGPGHTALALLAALAGATLVAWRRR